ncbi:MAG: hypothetical protein ACT4N8_00880 [Sphingosinicella sp.]|uniref:hypothetical protein n=1 Tax=Sphingosinicella sp. TaxID=1917971 RepID=UPI0040378423
MVTSYAFYRDRALAARAEAEAAPLANVRERHLCAAVAWEAMAARAARTGRLRLETEARKAAEARAALAAAV